jgi:hypothetical protein
LPYLASLVLTVVATYLIVVGFSPDVLRALRTYRSDDDVFWFVVMVAIPPFVNYVIWNGIYRAMAQNQM